MIYEYRCDIYFNEDAVSEAIVEFIAEFVLGDVVYEETKAYEDEWEDVEELDPNDFNVYKQWCKQVGLVASHYNSLARYMKEVKQ